MGKGYKGPSEGHCNVLFSDLKSDYIKVIH